MILIAFLFFLSLKSMQEKSLFDVQFRPNVFSENVFCNICFNSGLFIQHYIIIAHL
jgi:hypothetical protein